MSANPAIKNPDRIFPNQLIKLPPLGGTIISSERANGIPTFDQDTGRSCTAIATKLESYSPEERNFLGDLNLYDAYSTAAGGFFDVVGKASLASIDLVKNIVLQYFRKESGMISVGQYDYARGKSIKAINHQLGPLHHLVNPGKRPGEVLRIQPNASHRAARHLSEIDKLARIAKVAKTANIIVSVVDLGLTGAQIANAKSDDERTIIVVEKAGSLAGTALASIGIGIGVAAMATPVGWVGLILITAATAGAGAAGGEIAKRVAANEIYDADEGWFDIWSDKAWAALSRKAK
ncbi:hypothetical protein [Fulvimarina sp. MAC3]|uniref:hypothetical protein n=1 Tax=Fulvimarina sp. MAC3 TaxID=3148887 RepID=UPI0031FDCE2B